MMDSLPNVRFYIKDDNDRIVTLNARNCEISALRDKFDAIGKKSSDLFPDIIAKECLARDAVVRKTGKAVVGGINYATVDRSQNPTIYSVFPLHDVSGKLIGTMCGFYYTEKTDSSHVATIALETGFYDQSHFVKAFRNIYRISPTAYRRRHGAAR